MYIFLKPVEKIFPNLICCSSASPSVGTRMVEKKKTVLATAVFNGLSPIFLMDLMGSTGVPRKVGPQIGPYLAEKVSFSPCSSTFRQLASSSHLIRGKKGKKKISPLLPYKYAAAAATRKARRTHARTRARDTRRRHELSSRRVHTNRRRRVAKTS